MNKTLLQLLLIVPLGISSVAAHTDATGVVKQRMDLMKGVGKDMKGMKALVTGEVEFSAAAMAQHGASIAVAADQALEYFPEGSLDKPTEALPAIWQDWDKFSGLMQKLGKDARALEAMGSSADKATMAKQFGLIGKNCRACHTDFRMKKR